MNLYIPFPYSKGLHNKHGLCTFKHKFVHTPCMFKQKFVRTLCMFKHFQKINPTPAPKLLILVAPQYNLCFWQRDRVNLFVAKEGSNIEERCHFNITEHKTAHCAQRGFLFSCRGGIKSGRYGQSSLSGTLCKKEGGIFISNYDPSKTHK